MGPHGEPQMAQRLLSLRLSVPSGDLMSYVRRMTTLSQASTAGRHADALALARALKTELLADSLPDPELLGWARDYELRSLYHLGRFAEGLEILRAGEPHPFLIATKNAAWLESVGAEMSARCGLDDGVVHHGVRALGLRLDDGDTHGAGLAIQTVRALLDMVGRPDLAMSFTDEVEALWSTHEPGGRRAMDAAVAVSQVAGEDWYLADLPDANHRRRDWLLREVALLGEVEQARALVDGGASPNARDPRAPGLPTALIQAAYAGHADLVAFLLDVGASTALANVQGRTALHQAADQGHATVVRLLCEAGADVAALDFCAHTPLHVACWQDHLAAVESLVAAGAPLDRGDVNGDAPLALSATERPTRVLRHLLTVDPHLDRTNHFGQSALHGAAIAGIGEAVALLLEAGADPDLRDRNGMTPLQWARHEGHPEVAALLAKAG